MKNFWDVNWGPDEAKGDKELIRYFVQIPDYDGLLKGDIRYIIGRKGTGKTAVIEKLKYDIDENPLSFSKSFSLRYFPLNIVRDLRDKSLREKAQFVPVWYFLILTEVCKLIAEDNGIENHEAKEDIKRFVNDNFPEGLAFVDTLTFLQSNKSKVALSKSFLSAEKSKDRSREVNTHIHYQKAIDILAGKVHQISSESTYYLLFDELDEGFKAGDSNLRLLLLSLLRAIEDIYIDFNQSELNIIPILALRSDIFDRLEDNDLNKLDDYVLRLCWLTESKTGYSLKDIANQRIIASLGDKDMANPWDQVVNDKDRQLPKKIDSIWKFISARTFERPRDLIKFMKCCSKIKNHKGKLTYVVAKEAETNYSRWFYSEFRDEIHSYLPVWREALQCISRLNKGIFTFDEIKFVFNRSNVIYQYMLKDKKDENYILEILFDFGAIGNLNGKRWLFRYKDADLPWDPTKKIILHYALHNKLRIKG